jgi:hypothetical protein
MELYERDRYGIFFQIDQKITNLLLDVCSTRDAVSGLAHFYTVLSVGSVSGPDWLKINQMLPKCHKWILFLQTRWRLNDMTTEGPSHASTAEIYPKFASLTLLSRWINTREPAPSFLRARKA